MHRHRAGHLFFRAGGTPTSANLLARRYRAASKASDAKDKKKWSQIRMSMIASMQRQQGSVRNPQPPAADGKQDVPCDGKKPVHVEKV